MITEDKPPIEQQKAYKPLPSLTVAIACIVACLLFTHNYVEEKNELCKNGKLIHATIYQLSTSTGEGSHSWILNYLYTVEGHIYSGSLAVPLDKKFKPGDPLKVVYSISKPDFHKAFDEEVDNTCIDFLTALFKFHNIPFLFTGLFIILAINQKSTDNE